MEKDRLLKDDSDYLNKVNVLIEDIKSILMNQNAEDSYHYIEWMKLKTELRYGEIIKHEFYILNNCIYWAHMGRNVGSEQDKHRPILVIYSEKI